MPDILVVDDTPEIRLLLDRLLTQEGHAVRQAARGEEALQAVAKAVPDLILLDVMMPGLDGFEVCRRLKQMEETRLVPVVLLTAQRDRESRMKGLEAGADDYLNKPFDRLELLVRVRNLCRIRSLTVRLEDSRNVIYSLARAIEARDAYTEGHTERVAEYAVALGRTLDLSETDLQWVEQGAILHDVGKIGIRDSILNKPGPLTPEEYEQMKTHSALGEHICKSLKSLAPILDIIRHHQERIDGKGYPDGLTGDRMSVGARIVALVDAYDAMTSDRPYRKRLERAEAVRRLREGAGTQWDARMVEAFIGWIEAHPETAGP